MKKILCFFLLITITNGFSQKDPNIYDFFGGKTFGNNAVFFRLVFQINNGNVNGYMFTDEQGSQETKSIIKGKFNYKTKRISFIETRKLLSRVSTKFENSCYLEGNLSLELNPKISKLKGLFIEQTVAKEKCFNGKINLISLDAYKQLTAEIKKEKIDIVKPIKQIKDTIKEPVTILPAFETDRKTTIKDDEEVIVYWESKILKLSVWDDMKEDGDKISIQLNDKPILDHFELKNIHKDVELDLIKGENILIITANNTGTLANNTARVDLFDNELKHQIITELKVNKSVKIIIKKQ